MVINQERIQQIERLSKDLKVQLGLYVEACNKDEVFQVKRDILTSIRTLQNQIAALKNEIDGERLF